MDLEALQGKLASSCVDLGSIKLLRIPALISVSFYTCDSVLRDPLEFQKANQASLVVRWGTWNFSALSAGESGLILWRVRSLMFFLGLRQEPGI